MASTSASQGRGVIGLDWVVRRVLVQTLFHIVHLLFHQRQFATEELFQLRQFCLQQCQLALHNLTVETLVGFVGLWQNWCCILCIYRTRQYIAIVLGSEFVSNAFEVLVERLNEFQSKLAADDFLGPMDVCLTTLVLPVEGTAGVSS